MIVHQSDNSLATSLSKELKQLSHILADDSQPLEERIAAFEHITDSEVGDTPLIRARNLERELNIRQLYLKFEGGNPTGTQKDRIAFAQAMDALRRGYKGITLATCGNYGMACAFATRFAKLHCIIYIPSAYHTKRIEEMQQLGAEIVRFGETYEDAVEASKQFAIEADMYDANPGGDNTPLQLQAYGQIAYEIYDELRDAPKIVAAPISNGTMLAGIYKGFQSLYRRGKTSRIPHIVAGSAYKKNPIVQAFVKNKAEYEDLKPEKIEKKETKINEPLINWHSYDGDIMLDAIRDTKGWASDITDKRMVELARLLRQKEGLQALPASTAGLAALIKSPQPDAVQNDRFVVILTSRL